MSCKNKFDRTEIICLKKPSALDKLVQSVPKPKGAIPNFGLPKWKKIPLESKIPMISGPKNAYNFTRQKLGKKLWIGSSNAEFNISDPCNYEIKFQYEAFHDEHLKDFFKRPVNSRRMIKLGFVTKEMDAKCSVRDYNMYRKYLKKLHDDSVIKELKRQAELNLEEKVIKLAEDKARNDMEKLRKFKTVRNLKEAKEKMNKIREDKLKSIMKKYSEKIKKVEKAREEDLRKRISQGREKREKMRRCREMAARLDRQKLIKIITDWKLKERKRKKMRKMQLVKEQQEKEKLIQERWNKRQQFQVQQLEREEFLMHCIDEERKIFIQKYNKKVERERKKLKDLFEKTKTFVKNYANRYINRRKRVCCKSHNVRKLPRKLTSQYKQDEQSKTNATYLKNTASKKKLQKRKNKLQRGKNKQNHKRISTLQENEDSEFNVSCTKIIPQDDSKSKCECEMIKLLKRYENE